MQIIYASRPFGYDDATINGILLDARRCNERDGVTGALICRRDIFLQLLEGPPKVVEATFDRIKRDDRHIEARVFFSGDIPERLFGDWAMLHDPAISWIWSMEEIADNILDRLGPLDFQDVFHKLSKSAQTGRGIVS